MQDSMTQFFGYI